MFRPKCGRFFSNAYPALQGQLIIHDVQFTTRPSLTPNAQYRHMSNSRCPFSHSILTQSRLLRLRNKPISFRRYMFATLQYMPQSHRCTRSRRRKDYTKMVCRRALKHAAKRAQECSSSTTLLTSVKSNRPKGLAIQNLSRSHMVPCTDLIHEVFRQESEFAPSNCTVPGTKFPRLHNRDTSNSPAEETHIRIGSRIQDTIEALLGIPHLFCEPSHLHYAAGVKFRTIGLDSGAYSRPSHIAHFISLSNELRIASIKISDSAHQYQPLLWSSLVKQMLLDGKSYAIQASDIILRIKAAESYHGAREFIKDVRQYDLEFQRKFEVLLERLAKDYYNVFLSIYRQILMKAYSSKQVYFTQNDLLDHVKSDLLCAPCRLIMTKIRETHAALDRELFQLQERHPSRSCEHRKPMGQLFRMMREVHKDTELMFYQLSRRWHPKNKAIYECGICVPFVQDICPLLRPQYKNETAKYHISDVQSPAPSTYEPSRSRNNIYKCCRRRCPDAQTSGDLQPRTTRQVHGGVRHSACKRNMLDLKVVQSTAPSRAYVPLHACVTHFKSQLRVSIEPIIEAIVVSLQKRDSTLGRAFAIPSLEGAILSADFYSRQQRTRIRAESKSGKFRPLEYIHEKYTSTYKTSSANWHRLRFSPTTSLQSLQQSSTIMGSRSSHDCPTDDEPNAVSSRSADVDLTTVEVDHELQTSRSCNIETGPQSGQGSMAQTQEIIAVAQNISENSDKDGSSKATDDETDIDKDIVDEVEEHIPLDFQIPPETLRAAMQALPNSAGSFWSQTLYRGPENQMILVHYSTTTELSERVAKYFLEEKVLGFDIEWKPQQRNSSIKDNVSLIQIACEDRIALFHIAQHMGTTSEELLPPSLKTIIESPDILKVGVAIKSDFSRIRKFMGINPRGVFEISRLHNQVEHFGTAQEISWKLTSLATQVQQHLLLPLFKGRTSNDPEDDEQSVRVSDWSLPLRKDQMEYAASDAYAGFRLFDTLEAKRKTLKPIPARPLVCDSDDGSRPRSKHSKPAAKVAVENPDMEEVQQAGDDVLEGMKQGQEQDVGSEEDAYATAAEELTDGEEADSESTSSGADSDPDADYVPTSRELRQLSLNLDLPVRPPHSTQQRPRRLGRLGPAMLTPSDMPVSISKVEYPKLPSFSSDEGHSSDSSDAFDPPIQRPKQQHSPKKATSLGSSFEEQVNTDPEDPEGRITFPNSQISQSNSDPYQLASTWASTYLKDTIPAPSFSRSSPPSRIRATLSPLRAYHMWHHQKLPLERIAELLREPPLALSTVCGYIVKATSMEKLEYENAAMKEVLKSLPVGLRRGRGRWMNTEMGD